MDHILNRNLKAASLIFAILLISGCSSSSVETSGDPAIETAAGTEAMSDTPPGEEMASTDAPPGEAPTDAVPAASPAAEATVVDASAAVSPPPADATLAPVAEAPVPPPADLSTTSPPPATVENPTLAQQPAPQSFDASTNPPPAPTAAELAANTPVSGEVSQYKVKRGDTLMKIAFENYGDLYRWKEIQDGNQGKVKSSGELVVGTVLTLSGAGMVTIERNGEKYLIKTGDTLGLISNEVYGTKAKWKKLWENNRQLIKNPNRIYAGFNLYYVPEARLTGEGQEAAPAPADGGSASNQPLPFKSANPSPEVATGSAPEAPRAPASAK